MLADNHDNTHTLYVKILRTLHDQWEANPASFLAEPYVPDYLDGEVRLLKRILDSLDSLTSGGSSSGGLALFAEAEADILLDGDTDIPVVWSAPTGSQAGGLSSSVWTAGAAGAYIIAVRTSFEFHPGGPNVIAASNLYVNGIQVHETPAPIEIVDTVESAAAPITNLVTRNLVPGDTVAVKISCGGTGQINLLAGDNGVGGRQSFIGITQVL